MSQRGSFVTEYIYCAGCVAAVQRVLPGEGKYLHVVRIPSWNEAEGPLPIFAGKIGGLYDGEELHTFECEIVPRLAAAICHPLRVAVLAEAMEGAQDRETVFHVLPVSVAT